MADGDPCMVIRLQPMPGNLCRFSYATLANDGEGRVLVDLAEVQERIATTSGLLYTCAREGLTRSSSLWGVQIPDCCEFVSDHTIEHGSPTSTFDAKS